MPRKITLKPITQTKSPSTQENNDFSRRGAIRIISNPIGTWNPFPSKKKCIICWKPLNFDKDAIMECPHCHSQAHQEHMLRWLSKKNYCPYCRTKW
ncbi:MAG: RING finger domain-containing protein [Candidatus Hodarchaeales archaeon]